MFRFDAAPVDLDALLVHVFSERFRIAIQLQGTANSTFGMVGLFQHFAGRLYMSSPGVALPRRNVFQRLDAVLLHRLV